MDHLQLHCRKSEAQQHADIWGINARNWRVVKASTHAEHVLTTGAPTFQPMTVSWLDVVCHTVNTNMLMDLGN